MGHRRPRDFYETAAFMRRALLANVPEIGGSVLECCAGDGSIASVLTAEGGLSVLTNDVSRTRTTDMHADASSNNFWRTCPPVDWVVCNPPYRGDLCLPIVQLAVEHARIGVAMMLRLSFKEPTATGTRERRLRSGRLVPASSPRGPWLASHPVTRELVMPRYSFTGNGKSDSVTTAWMIWSMIPLAGPAHVSCYDADRLYLEPWQRAA